MKIGWRIWGVLILLWGFSLRAEPGEVLKLSLDECIKLALENSPQIKMAEAKVESARGKLVSTRSYLIPQLNASGVYTRASNLPEFKSGEMQMIPTSFPFANESTPLPPTHLHFIPFPSFEMSNTREGDIYNFKIELTYPVYTGGRTTQGYKASKLELEASELELAQARLDLVSQVKQAFYQVVLAQEMVRVIDQAYQVMEGHYRQVKALYNEGYVSNLDLLQVKSRLSSLRPQQIQAHNGLELAKLALKNILYLAPETDVEVVGKLEYQAKEIPELSQVLETALNQRPDLKSLEIRKKQAEAGLKIARAGYLPTVALFANYQWSRGQEMPPNDEVWREGWQAGVSASINLFDGLKTYGDMKSARSQLEQVSWGKRALERGVEIEVTSAYLKLVSARENVEAQKVNVESARENFETAKEKYRQGMANNLEVMDAEVNLTRARADYLRAVSDWLIAWVELEKAIGKMEVEKK